MERGENLEKKRKRKAGNSGIWIVIGDCNGNAWGDRGDSVMFACGIFGKTVVERVFSDNHPATRTVQLLCKYCNGVYRFSDQCRGGTWDRLGACPV